jgi:hypothetical protein
MQELATLGAEYAQALECVECDAFADRERVGFRPVDV